jgi:serine protease Do/serine protease DegQ
MMVLMMVCGLARAGGLPGVVDGEPLPSLAPMLEKTTPAVVNISTRGSVARGNNPLFDDPFFRQFFDFPRTQRRATQSLGSGVIVESTQGLVVTNHHVIEDAEEVLVTLSDGREFEAQVIGQDPEADVAVIRIDADDLEALTWADSDALRVGDFVVAIGNPFGLGQTVTSGIVSALGRSGLGIEEIEDFIQTDASINPGNSGGALVNLRGELVGINTAIVGPGGGNVGIGFAIPSNMARNLMQQIVEGGEVRRGRLGISLQELDEDLQQVFGVERGVVISGVEESSPADQAGLLRGDVITRVGDRRVASINDVRNAIGLLQVGDQVVVQFYRDKTLYQTDIRVGESEDTQIRGEALAAHLQGAIFENAISRRGRPFVLISEVRPGSAIARYGLEQGDIVLAVNRVPVADIEGMASAVALRQDASVLEIQRGNFSQSVLIE